MMAQGSNLATARGSIFSVDFTMVKHSNINISKAGWRILIKLHTQGHCAVGKVGYCFWAGHTGTLVAVVTYTF